MDDTKRILMLTTSYGRIDDAHPTGLWFEEFAVPFERFTAEGYLVTAASIKGGAVPIDPRSEPQDKQALNVAGPREVLKHTQRLIEVDVSEYDAVFFPGGHGTMFDLPRSHEVTELVTRFMMDGRAISVLRRHQRGLGQVTACRRLHRCRGTRGAARSRHAISAGEPLARTRRRGGNRTQLAGQRRGRRQARDGAEPAIEPRHRRGGDRSAVVMHASHELMMRTI